MLSKSILIFLISLNGFLPILNIFYKKIRYRELAVILMFSQILCYILIDYSEYLVTVCISMIIYIFIYKESKNKYLSLTLTIMSTLLTLISDYTTSNILTIFLKENILGFLNTNKHGIYIYTGLNLITIFLFSRIVGNILNKKICIVDIKFKGMQSFLINSILIYSLFLFYYFTIFGKKVGLNNNFLNITGLFLLLYSVLFISIILYLFNNIKTELEFKHKKELLENLKIYTDELERLYSNMRKFKHDYINILSTMSLYIADNDMESLNEFFVKNINYLLSQFKDDKLKIENLINIEIPELKSILSIKTILSQHKGINFDIEVSEKINNISMNILDLSRIIGILLDNAIEASEEATPPFIKVAFIKNTSSVKIIILNSYIKNNLNINNIFKYGVTSKRGNMGIGLSNFREIINEYNNVFFEFSDKDGNFYVELEIFDE